jgi:hypothetical protein
VLFPTDALDDGQKNTLPDVGPLLLLLLLMMMMMMWMLMWMLMLL